MLTHTHSYTHAHKPNTNTHNTQTLTHKHTHTHTHTNQTLTHTHNTQTLTHTPAAPHQRPRCPRFLVLAPVQPPLCWRCSTPPDNLHIHTHSRAHKIRKIGQNHKYIYHVIYIYGVYKVYTGIRCFLQGDHQTYGHIRS